MLITCLSQIGMYNEGVANLLFDFSRGLGRLSESEMSRQDSAAKPWVEGIDRGNASG